MRTITFLTVFLLCFPACLKQRAIPTTTRIDEDEDEDKDNTLMDHYVAQLEEIQSAEEIQSSSTSTCKEVCELKACDIAKNVCAIAAKYTRNSDFGMQCISAEEVCANFSEKCEVCSD